MAVGLSTMAQVYSLNVVGYYNVTVVGGGKTLIANQLNVGSGATKNDIGLVLPNPTESAGVLKFVNNDYNTDVASGGAWYDAGSGNPSTTKLNPGEGFFYDNPNSTASTLTFVGEVPQGPVNVTFNGGGKTLVSTATPQALELSAANGFPMAENTGFLRFQNNDYWTAIVSGGQWYDAGSGDPTTIIPAVGQGYFIDNPSSSSVVWSRTFTVQ